MVIFIRFIREVLGSHLGEGDNYFLNEKELLIWIWIVTWCSFWFPGFMVQSLVREKKIPLWFLSCDLMIDVYLKIKSWLCRNIDSRINSSCLDFYKIEKSNSQHKTNWTKNCIGRTPKHSECNIEKPRV